MPAEANKRRSLFWALGIFFLILISFRAYATSTNTMDSLPAPFTIEIDGKPILKVAADAADHTQAETGTEPAAVFELKDKRLQSDGHILARALAEDRSFKPKKVMWFKAKTETLVHEVVATKEGEEYQLQFSGAGLTAIEGNVFADLMGSHPAHVVVKMQS